MIKKLWRRIFDSTEQPVYSGHQLIVLSRDKHNVSRKQISKNALKVLYRLNNAGFEAYLVGGGVRDILLDLSPKDFDIATSATPEQVGKLFRNCRLIGRRFRLAHILFGREVIEVATFRAGHHDSSSHHAHKSEQGLLVRDNVYGNLEEDAFRRDFTVNALYYSADDFTVRDYVGGLADLEARQLRLIGDAEARYREDPVRILRAIRLSCKLDLSIETATAAPIGELSEMLEHVSPARLWDECNKLFLAGYAAKTWQSLMDFDVARHLFDQTCLSLEKDTSGNFQQFVNAALNSTDKRIKQQQPVTPAFLFAVFLWQPMQSLTEKLIAKGIVPYEASQKAAAKVVDNQRQSIAIPKRFSIVAREIWSLQFRLTNRRKRNVDSLLQHARFRAAYDFLCLRAGDDPQLKELAKWWTEFQDADPEQRQKLLKQFNQNKARGNRNKNRNRRKPRNHIQKSGQSKD